MNEQTVTLGVVIGVFCAAAYAIAMLLFKRAHQYGSRPYAQLLVSAIVQIVLYGGFFFVAELPEGVTGYIFPAIGALLMVIGQTCTVLAIFYGDASVQTPLMGTKTVFVSFLNVFFLGAVLSTDLWIGTIAATVAVFFLGWSRQRVGASLHGGRSLWLGVVFTLLSAFSFAALDIVLVRAVRDVDPFFALPFVMVTSGILFLLTYPFAGEPRRLPPVDAWRWLIGGAFLYIGQTVVFGLSISFLQIPTVLNIAYSSRALWSLLFVLIIGRAIGIHEATMERRTVLLRGAGALTVIVAIAVIIV